MQDLWYDNGVQERTAGSELQGDIRIRKRIGKQTGGESEVQERVRDCTYDDWGSIKFCIMNFVQDNVLHIVVFLCYCSTLFIDLIQIFAIAY